MAMLSNLDLIRRVPLFSLLTYEQATAIADSVVKRRFRRGEIIVEHGAVEIDDAADKFRREDADAAKIEQVDGVVLAHGVIAQMRVAVNHAVAIEGNIPGAEHIHGQAVALFGRRVDEVQNTLTVQPCTCQ